MTRRGRCLLPARPPPLLLLLLLLACTVALPCVWALATPSGHHHDEPVAPVRHTNNWAVLVGTSRFWFNYRHVANTLSMYRTVKRLGIPDSNIILMLADDMACNPRNPYAGEIFNHVNKELNLYGESIEVDYRGNEVTIENFLRVLTGRFDDAVPRSKRLLSDDRSNIFIFMSGHGGDEYLKFQDAEEISSQDIADAFEQMWQKRRYNEIFFMIDTCQANTMYSRFYSPHILACGSSEKGEVSYAHHTDSSIGVAVVDRFTYYTLEFLEGVDHFSSRSVHDLFASYSYDALQSTFGYRSDLLQRDIREVKLTDFLGYVQPTELMDGAAAAASATSAHALAGETAVPEIPPSESAEVEEAAAFANHTLSRQAWDRLTAPAPHKTYRPDPVFSLAAQGIAGAVLAMLLRTALSAWRRA